MKRVISILLLCSVALFGAPIQHMQIAAIKKQAGGGGDPFSPDDIAGLHLWLKADGLVYNTGTTQATDGQTVETWVDASGEGNDAVQATSGNRPTFQTNEINGLPCLRFDSGRPDFMAGTIAVVGGAVTVFVISKRTSGNACYVDLSPDGGNNQNGFIHYSEATVEKIEINGGGACSYSNASTSWQYKGTRHLTADRQTYLDGVSQDTDTTSLTLATTTVYRIGRFYLGDIYPLNGDIAEIIVYNSSLSDPDMASVHAYLADKYGL